MESEFLDYLKTFIAFETIEGNTRAQEKCLDWISETFLSKSKYGIVRGGIGGAPYLFVPHPSTQLMWFAHIDVVPGLPEQFVLRVCDDRAYGRGSNDMKGAQLPFLYAYKEMLEAGRDPSVSILLTSDEEVGGHSIPTLLKQGILDAPIAFTPDTGGMPYIVVGHKGALWGTLRVKGKSAHGAWPWRGENPNFVLADALQRIQRAFPIGQENDWKMTVVPTELHGSDAHNTIPEYVTCSLDIRFPANHGSTPEDIIAIVQKELPDNCELVCDVFANPLDTNPDHPMVQLMKRFADEITASDVPIRHEHGASDARYFQEHSIPAFLYSPTGEEPHGTKEWVSITSMLEHYRVNKKLLETLVETREPILMQ